MLLTLWARVEDYLYDHVGIEPLSSAKEEKKHLSVLLESETFLVALLCLLSDEHYSAGSLVDAMVGVNASADQRGNARKRILNRTLPIVGDNSMEYSICRSQRLVDFAELNLVTGINDILGIDSLKAGSGKAVCETGKRRSQDVVVVVNKLKTYWVKAPYSEGRIRITVPVRYYLSSWDVKALEAELERLGVKVKPRPTPPKPSGLISG